jgi:multidrug resistance efflux pump
MTIDLSAEAGQARERASAIGNNKIDSNQRSFSQSQNQRRTVLLIIVAFIALLCIAYGAFQFYSSHSEDPNIVKSSGRIEATETHIEAPASTRVKSVFVKEGDSVHKGQLLVTLDSGILKEKIGQSGPALKAALHARKETDAQVAAVQQEIKRARAKSKGLLAKIFSTKSGRKQKELQLRTEMMQAKMMSMQARSAVASVEGAREQATSKLSYFNITSPIDGICTIRSTQPGELVSAGQVMLTIVDPNSAYMRGFVTEADVARIKIGQAAQVFLDSNSTKANSDSTEPLNGKVTSIDAAPSFTPENVYFKNDRVRQAFGIKISIDHPNGMAKPGMPAEAKIVLAPKNKEKNKW